MGPFGLKFFKDNMKETVNRKHCCCPSCKHKNGIKTEDALNETSKALCTFCNWEGQVKDLLCDSEDYNYHDHEPGID